MFSLAWQDNLSHHQESLQSLHIVLLTNMALLLLFSAYYMHTLYIVCIYTTYCNYIIFCALQSSAPVADVERTLNLPPTPRLILLGMYSVNWHTVYELFKLQYLYSSKARVIPSRDIWTQSQYTFWNVCFQISGGTEHVGRWMVSFEGEGIQPTFLMGLGCSVCSVLHISASFK